MKKLTLIAAGLLAAAATVHAETTTQAAPMPYGAPYAAPTAEQIEAHQARMRAFFEEQAKARQAAMEEMAKRHQQAMEQVAGARPVPFQAPPFDAPTFEAPTFEAPEVTGPLTRAEVDAMFEERRQEMEEHFAKAFEDMEAARQDFAADRPQLPAAFDDGRYEEHLKRFEASREAAEERMAELRAEVEQARSEAYTGPVM